ncbi:rho GTPase-activating protein 45-like isoform X2 [Brienomyrus brachyistius]|uniref:rho GTPase-activating protein 45-like isoform X2 n=1 Tax=Brienomyrus brachyistius TaxID=42636 RepID=UPI0020B3D2E6|nr:rho GTPase-activating protein 45-like isoform X2 [Brienomyrus brachyistius]
MLKRGVGGKSSYSPYSVTDYRSKKSDPKGKSKLDILPNKPNVWLKQLSVLQEQPPQDGLDPLDASPSSHPNPSPSCPGTPVTQHARLSGSASPMATLRRSSTCHQSSTAGFPVQSWVFSKGLRRAAAAQDVPPDCGEGPAIEAEDIPTLLQEVASFAEAVEKLKDVVLAEDERENRQALAHECLGEVLRILRQVFGAYPLLNTVETLTAAGRLISKVKGFHYEGCSDLEKKDFEKAVEMIAVAFSSSVSELLMGEVDSSTLLSLLPSERSRSLENLYGSVSGKGPNSTLSPNDPPHTTLSAEEVDIVLQHSEGGVESALSYAKGLSKCMKDVIGYVEKRSALEMEFAKGLQKIYQACKPSFEQPHMPFMSTYNLALEQDQEQSLGVLQASGTLHVQNFIQPLVQRKFDHEKKCKELKDVWQRARRKLAEAESNLRKAKQVYQTRCEEYDKAKAAASRAEEEGGGSAVKTLDRKRRHEEEARGKAEEAEATYRTCVADAKTQHQELEDTKVTVLRLIQDIIRQSDQALRSATVSYCQMMHMQTVALPVHYQALCESSRLYEPGLRYATYVEGLSAAEEPEVQYDFEPYVSPMQSGKPCTDSINAESHDSAESSSLAGRGEGVSAAGSKQKYGRGHQPNKSWPTVVNDTDSMGERSSLGSPTSSTGDVRMVPRTLSSGTMSSTEELDDKENNVVSFEHSMNGIEPEIAAPTGPFRNVGLSKAAQTHRLRKLRTPAKCRECDSYVYFQGAECEECLLACHKKCLESLAIQCGHRKLQGRLHLFGRDFNQNAHCSAEGVPFIIKKCILEIESRALKMKGIYRVNGVKTRVEKLCQAFENGMELVELSHAFPHDVSNVLKLYLRQLPEPIMPFQLYSRLMGLAKESLQAEAPDREEPGKGLAELGSETDSDILLLVDKLRDLVKELPRPNLAILRYIVSHLRRVAALEEHNKMSPSNLGIVFGPTLMRPRPTGTTVTLSSLVDYPHQARIVEMLVVFYSFVFPVGSGDSSQPTSPIHSRVTNTDPCGKPLGRADSCERFLDSDGDPKLAGGGSQGDPHSLDGQEKVTCTVGDPPSPTGSRDLPGQPPISGSDPH